MSYLKSIEIEHFLKSILKPREGSKESNEMKGLFHSIFLYEKGLGAIDPSEHKREVECLLEYFERIMNKLLNEQNTEFINHLKVELVNMKTSKDISRLYQQLKSMEKCFNEKF